MQIGSESNCRTCRVACSKEFFSILVPLSFSFYLLCLTNPHSIAILLKWFYNYRCNHLHTFEYNTKCVNCLVNIANFIRTKSNHHPFVCMLRKKKLYVHVLKKENRNLELKTIFSLHCHSFIEPSDTLLMSPFSTIIPRMIFSIKQFSIIRLDTLYLFSLPFQYCKHTRLLWYEIQTNVIVNVNLEIFCFV